MKIHGHTKTGWQSPTYVSWASMTWRCKTHPDYAGKGIKVCRRWRKFKAFLEDMGVRPSKKHTIDRLDGTGHYEPNNCRWATKKEQAGNMTSNVVIKIDTLSMILTDWLKEIDMSYWTYAYRVEKGMTPQEALLTPVDVHKPKSPEHKKKLSDSAAKALTQHQKREARAMRSRGNSFRAIAEYFDVGQSTIARACGAKY